MSKWVKVKDMVHGRSYSMWLNGKSKILTVRYVENEIGMFIYPSGRTMLAKEISGFKFSEEELEGVKDL